MSRSLALLADSSGAAVFVIFYLAVIALVIVGWWMTFVKAGEKGWKSIIPFYNVYTMLKIVGRPGWWLVLFFVPFVNIVIIIILMNDISKSFGHGVGFTLGLIFLSFVFVPILGFGSSRFLGPAAAPGAVWAPPPPPPA